MTIKELEQRTGMARANIRYYENEGLITPERLTNGYRDYSEEDVRTLEKIKLLRQLHMDIDTIRLVQRGELTLEQAMFSLLTRLEGDKAAIGRAAEVCRQLEQSGVEYAALEPEPWLKQLEMPKRQTLPDPEPPVCTPPPEESDHGCRARSHPWMRLLARGVDMTLYQTLFYVVMLAVFRQWKVLDLPVLVDWLLELAFLLVTFLVEPLWLHFWGWTPGKWLFGLKLRNKAGEKLSLRQAWTRGWRVAGEGYGWNIPIWSLYRLWKGRRCCLDGYDCPWDGEEDYRYTREERRLYGLRWLAVYAVCIAAMVLAGLQTYMPPNRGDLTVAEYCENFNYYLNRMTDSDSRLDETGCWVTETEPGVFVIDLSTVECGDLTFSVEEDRVTAVTLTEKNKEGPDQSILWMSQIDCQVATAALAGAQKRFNCVNFDLNGWLKIWLDRWDSFETDYRGVHISQTVECSGYMGTGQARTAIEGQEQAYRRTVTISLIGSD